MSTNYPAGFTQDDEPDEPDYELEDLRESERNFEENHPPRPRG